MPIFDIIFLMFPICETFPLTNGRVICTALAFHVVMKKAFTLNTRLETKVVTWYALFRGQRFAGSYLLRIKMEAHVIRREKQAVFRCLRMLLHCWEFFDTNRWIVTSNKTHTTLWAQSIMLCHNLKHWKSRKVLEGVISFKGYGFLAVDMMNGLKKTNSIQLTVGISLKNKKVDISFWNTRLHIQSVLSKTTVEQNRLPVKCYNLYRAESSQMYTIGTYFICTSILVHPKMSAHILKSL